MKQIYTFKVMTRILKTGLSTQQDLLFIYLFILEETEQVNNDKQLFFQSKSQLSSIKWETL